MQTFGASIRSGRFGNRQSPIDLENPSDLIWPRCLLLTHHGSRNTDQRSCMTRRIYVHHQTRSFNDSLADCDQLDGVRPRARRSGRPFRPGADAGVAGDRAGVDGQVSLGRADLEAVLALPGRLDSGRLWALAQVPAPHGQQHHRPRTAGVAHAGALAFCFAAGWAYR